jgi:acyl-CoA hydrolase
VKKRRVADSITGMTELVLPEDTNSKGSIFGGRVLSLIDKCAAITAMRHARSEVVTISMDSVVFLNKVQLGNVLQLNARLNAAFGSSMEVEVTVRSEHPHTGKRTLTTTALVTMVAVDAKGRPSEVPSLELADDDEKERARQATARRKQRLASRARHGQRINSS